MSSRVCTTGHIQDTLTLWKNRALCPGVRFRADLTVIIKITASIYLRCCWGVKGWCRANALPRASIDIEDTSTSTCWGSKCLWAQLFSFLLISWAPPLVVIETCETRISRDYDTLARSLGWLSGAGPGWQSHKHITFSPVGHAWLPKWLRPVTAKRA